MKAGVKAKVKFNSQKILRASRSSSIRSLNHAAGAVRLTAKRSIRKSSHSSSAGSPPNTRRGLIRGSIRFAVDKKAQYALIGTSYLIAGVSGKPHEHGGSFRGENYPQRAFMMPALRKNKDRINEFWKNSVTK
jgi:hypothetical protein